jgi:hypothetical protein
VAERQAPVHVPGRADTPGLGLEYVFSIRIFLKERIRFSPVTPRGGRFYVPPARGDVFGPRLQGRVLPYSGAEWPRGRRDNVFEVNAHYMLEAADGTPIYIHNRGYNFSRDADGRPAPYGVGEGFASNAHRYLRVTPEFDTPEGPHDWLTRTVIVGTGTRYSDPEDNAIFDYYAVL